VLEFANPWILFALPLVPLFFFWNRRRPRAALRYSDLRAFDNLRFGRARRVKILSNLLRSLAILCLIVGLAGPRAPDRKTRVPAEGVTIVIVLDMSGSMFADTFQWQPGSPLISRNEAAKRAFQLFVQGGDTLNGIHFEGRSTERGTDAIGLVTFTNWPYPVCPPTLNHSVLLRLLEHTRRPSVLEEGSNIGDAIMEGLIRLDKTHAPRKVMILLSDGEHNFDRAEEDRKPLKPPEAAAFAAKLGIPIYTIDTGGDPDPSKSDYKQREDGLAVNKDIASTSGGKAFTANDGQKLLAVCKEIDQLERQPILSHSYRRYFEFYTWCVAAGLGLALCVFVLEQTIWRRIP
jgi:Ca-activated chloride channel family protein